MQNSLLGCPYLFKNFKSVKLHYIMVEKKKSIFGVVGGVGVSSICDNFWYKYYNLLLEWTFVSHNMGVRTQFLQIIYVFWIKCAQKSARYCRSNLRNILTFWGKEVRGQALPQNAPIILRTILTFLPDNLVFFYTKSAQKVNFSSNCAYIFPEIALIQGNLLTLLPDRVQLVIIIIYLH